MALSRRVSELKVRCYCCISHIFSLFHAAVLPDLANAQPENDLCRNANSLSIGSTVKGNNINSTIVPNIPFCVDTGALTATSRVDAPGAWYSVLGKGEGVRAYTCVGSKNTTLLNRAVMSVYRDGCDSLRCVSVSVPEKDEQFCPEGSIGEVISWFALEDVTYHLLVRGTNAELEGQFELHTRRLNSLLSNDVCWNAKPVTVSDQRIDVTLGGNKTTIDFRAKSCASSGVRKLQSERFNFMSTTGVWFLVEGIGGTMRVAPPCGGVDFTMRVYTGDCTSLTCTGRRTTQNVCGAGWGDENVIFVDTVAGENYYVFIETLSISTVRPTEIDILLSEGSGSIDILWRSSVLCLTALSTTFLLLRF